MTVTTYFGNVFLQKEEQRREKEAAEKRAAQQRSSQRPRGGKGGGRGRGMWLSTNTECTFE